MNPELIFYPLETGDTATEILNGLPDKGKEKRRHCDSFIR